MTHIEKAQQKALEIEPECIMCRDTGKRAVAHKWGEQCSCRSWERRVQLRKQIARALLEAKAEAISEYEANRPRLCWTEPHVLDDAGVCYNCAFGERAAELRKAAEECG